MKTALSRVVSWSSTFMFVLSNCSLMKSSSNRPNLNLPSVSGWNPKWYRHPQKWQMSSLKDIVSPWFLWEPPHASSFFPRVVLFRLVKLDTLQEKELVSELFYCNRCMKGLKEKTSQSKPMLNRETGENVMEERRVFTLGTSQERQTVHTQHYITCFTHSTALCSRVRLWTLEGRVRTEYWPSSVVQC